MLRHPRVCKYFREYNRCKFSEWCVYAHIVQDRDLENLKVENEKILEKITVLEKSLKENGENQRLEVIERKLDHFLTLEKEICEKYDIIVELEKHRPAMQE